MAGRTIRGLVRSAPRALLSVWAFTVALMLITLVMVQSLDEFHDRVDLRRSAQVMLAELESDLAEVHGEAADISSAATSSRTLAGFAERRADLPDNLDELSDLVGDDPVVTDIRQSLRRLGLALDELVRVVRAGDTAAAGELQQVTVGPAFEAFDDSIDAASDEYEAASERLIAISNAGMWLVILAAWATIGGLTWRYERSRRLSRRVLEQSRERFRTLAESAFEGVAVLREGSVVEVSGTFATILGYEADQMVGVNVVDLVAPEAQELMRRSVTASTQSQFEADGLRRDGSVVRLEIRTRPASYRGEPVQVTAIRDVTERKALEERLQHQAVHDSLTGLANRTLFTDRLEHALLRMRREQSGQVAVLFFDLDDFKVVNDSLGHAAGDQLLTVVADRMRACLRPEDTVARLGGDEFAVLLEDVEDETEAIAAAQRVTHAFKATPATLADGSEAIAVASIGIALGVPGVDSPASVLRNADLAMYEAKAQGKGRSAVFRPGMEVRARDRMELGNDLRHAIARDQLEVFYQPQVDMDSGRIRSVEALLRWHHPDRGEIPPSQFIPIAEQSGLILAIGEWVLDQACRQVARWHRTHPSAHGLTVSVNVSVHQFNHPKLAADVAATLQRSGLAPEYVILEITESALLVDNPVVASTLDALRRLGVRLAIDDFGTGYSSLSYLRRLSSDFLKIDKSFVDELGHDRDDEGIVKSILALAASLGITCVAEGVEDEGQRDHLRRLGCDLGQGFLFHRPTPPAILDALFEGRLDLRALAPDVSAETVPAETVPVADLTGR